MHQELFLLQKKSLSFLDRKSDTRLEHRWYGQPTMVEAGLLVTDMKLGL